MTITCTRCRDAGWYKFDLDVNHPDFGKLHRCECQQPTDKAKKVQELRQTSGMGALSYQTFDTFNTTIPGTLKPFTACWEWCQRPEGTLLLSGTTGTGKTHLANAIGNALLEQGRSVYYSVVPTILDKLRLALLADFGSKYEALMDELRRVDLLILDELGIQRDTEQRTELLYALINERYQYRMPLIITTNLSIPHPKLDKRLNSRLSDVAVVTRPDFGDIDVRTLDIADRWAA